MRRRQAGLAVAIILVGLATAALAAVLTFATPVESRTYSDEHDNENFDMARAALVWRAITDDNRPGSLPCPALDEGGVSPLLSGNHCPTYIGRLPWSTLGLPQLRDASGEVLWYALSPSLRDDNSAQPINSNTGGEISVVGSVPASDVAAVIIAPGVALNSQDRAANPTAAAHFLELENSDGNNTYQIGEASPTFNDKLIVITRTQLFNAVERRIANEIRLRLERYLTYNGYLPYANATDVGDFSCTDTELYGRVPNPNTTTIDCTGHASWDSGLGAAVLPSWFFPNGWHLLTYYALAPECTKVSMGCSGAVSLVVGSRFERGVVMIGSRPLPAQTPACLTASLCVEHPNYATNVYVRQSLSSFFNDKISVIR